MNEKLILYLKICITILKQVTLELKLYCKKQFFFFIDIDDQRHRQPTFKGLSRLKAVYYLAGHLLETPVQAARLGELLPLSL